MADNITAPATGAILATDEVGGVQYPRVKVAFGVDGSAADVSTASPFPVSIATSVPVTGTFFQATQPVSLASLPLPTGAATSANQTTEIAALSTIGTRAYGAPLSRLAYSGTSASSAGITATEVLVHNAGTGRCYIKAGSAPTATVNDIPLEAGEKFHLRITSGHAIAAIQDSTGGNLNIVPVA